MTREYTLFWTITGQPPGGIQVTVDIPAGWTETIDGMGSPTFTVPDLPGALIAIVAIHAPGTSAADRLTWALAKQFDADDLPTVERTPRGDGRMWAVHRPNGRLHARMFLPAPHDSIVIASVMTFTAPTLDPVPQVEPVFETVRVERSRAKEQR